MANILVLALVHAPAEARAAEMPSRTSGSALSTGTLVFRHFRHVFQIFIVRRIDDFPGALVVPAR